MVYWWLKSPHNSVVECWIAVSKVAAIHKSVVRISVRAGMIPSTFCFFCWPSNWGNVSDGLQRSGTENNGILLVWNILTHYFFILCESVDRGEGASSFACVIPPSRDLFRVFVILSPAEPTAHRSDKAITRLQAVKPYLQSFGQCKSNLSLVSHCVFYPSDLSNTSSSPRSESQPHWLQSSRRISYFPWKRRRHFWGVLSRWEDGIFCLLLSPGNLNSHDGAPYLHYPSRDNGMAAEAAGLFIQSPSAFRAATLIWISPSQRRSAVEKKRAGTRCRKSFPSAVVLPLHSRIMFGIALSFS